MSVSFVDVIEEVIQSGEVTLPVFSPTALRVQQELVKKEPDSRMLEQLITSDQSLSSQVLRMANSAFYRGLAQIMTVKAAIIRLGMREIGRIVLLSSSQSQFRSKDAEINRVMKKLWQHSAGCAIAANWLAKRCKFADLSSQAFFAGLLHDVGKLFVLMVIEQVKRKNAKLTMTDALFMEAIDTLHTRQGYELMQQWHMPEQYCLIVRDHHEPDVDSKNYLLLIVRLADMACHKLGVALSPEPDLNLASTMEAGVFGLTEIDVAELEVILEDTASLFS
ncbi:MAG: HDOD domain-containing protein [Desulfocapsaceae bacterium]|nr:HDOD domain-containing protein [Desulfocapsaceae bacterium]